MPLPTPSTETSETTCCTVWFTKKADTKYACSFAAEGDREYQVTVVMLGEAGQCLAFDPLPDQGEILTLAAAMGAPLAERLRRPRIHLAKAPAAP